MCAPPPARGTVNSSPRVRTDPRPPNGQDRQVSARVHRRTHSRPPETRPYACADWPAPWPDPTRSEDQPPINVHTTYVRHRERSCAVQRIALKLRRADEKGVIQYPTRAASFKRLLGVTVAGSPNLQKRSESEAPRDRRGIRARWPAAGSPSNPLCESHRWLRPLRRPSIVFPPQTQIHKRLRLWV